MKSKIILVILTVGLLVVGTTALFVENIKVDSPDGAQIKSIIRSFSGAFVQYPQRVLPGYSHL